MRQFGVLVKNIDLSQHGLHLLGNLNSLVAEYPDLCPIVFYETYSTLAYPAHFAMVQHKEAWLFDGPIIASSIDMVQTLLQCPRPNPKFFYVWNLDWIYMSPNQPSIQLSFLNHIYTNDDIQLIARSEQHARIIENCWKKPASIIEDFNYHDIAKLIKRTSKELPEPIM